MECVLQGEFSHVSSIKTTKNGLLVVVDHARALRSPIEASHRESVELATSVEATRSPPPHLLVVNVGNSCDPDPART